MDLKMKSTAGDNSLRLKVPSTQNTAPVLDFSCLYTHDIRRKAKRWQDGIVRFHTFNNRVMVYDVSRNFVGDTHWREPNPLQDGDDVELEKGVLIQIGESTGSTDQDLSDLFKKRRNPGVASPGRTPLAQPAAVGTANSTSVPLSQLRPKTLNSLLGKPKGPLGRAAIPLKSPCQLRRGNGRDTAAEARPAKRQRLETPAEKTTIPVPVSTAGSATATGPPSRGQNLNRNGNRTVEKTSTTRLDAVLPQKPTVPEKSAVKPTPKEASNPDDPAGKTYTGSLSTSKSSSPLRGNPAAPGARTNSRAQEKPQEVNIDIVNQLQIVARKPRKKLMYKNLLPQAASDTKLSEEQHSKRAKSNPEKLEGPEVDVQAKFHRAQHDKLKGRLKGIEEKERNQSHVTGSADSPHLIDSEDDAVSFSPKPDPVKEIPPNNLQSLMPSDEQGGRRIAPFMPFTKSLISFPTDLDSPIHDELARMDQILLQSTKEPLARNFQIRPPLPQQSNASKLHVTDIRPTTDPGSNPDSPLIQQNRPLSPLARPLNRSLSLPQGQTKRGPRAPLEKTISDPATLRRHSVTEQRPTPPDLVQDQKPDPWSREAWDLFGYDRPEKKGGEV
ncbi:hypothetical protein MMC22_012057 [Lobaria immixta]|nr:hypothetical protein [Lobaria immixta]